MQTHPFATKTYLVIDDFGEMRSMIKELLRILGATQIDAARDAGEGLGMIERNHYDVILCDYNLGGGKSGQQLLEELRHKQLIDMSTVFIMITAENTRDMVMAVVEYEPDSYLSKPFTKDLLGTRLRKMFERKADLSPIFRAIRLLDYKQAMDLVQQRIAAKPKNLPHLIRLKAEICLLAGQLDQARAIYEKLLQQRDIPWARLGLGKVQFESKQFADAADNFRYLVTHNQTLMAAHDWLAKTQLVMGFPADAQSTLENAVRLSPYVMNRQQALGELAMQNQDFALAETALSQAARLSQHSIYNNPLLHASLAKSKSAVGQHDKALLILEEIKNSFDSPVAAFYASSAEAAVWHAQNNPDASLAAFEKAEQLHRGLGKRAPQETHLELARAAAQLGFAQRSEEILRQAIRNNHDNEEFLAKTASVYREAGICEDATAIVHAIRQEVVQMNNRGVQLLSKGDFAEAIELFKQAADSMTGNLVINLNAAHAMVMQMEKQGTQSNALGMARRYLDRSREIAPDDPRIGKVLRRYQQLTAIA